MNCETGEENVCIKCFQARVGALSEHWDACPGEGGGGTRGFFGFEIFDSRIFLGIWQEFFLVA